MQQECSCGDSCPPCEHCDNPQCECYCDLYKEKDDEEETEQDDW